jgi:methionyl-tRNA formyltransferase
VAGEYGEPGELHRKQDRLFAACGARTWIELVEIQLEGKKRMPLSDFLRGHDLESGTKLGQS